MYHEYKYSGKISNLQQCGVTEPLKDTEHRQLSRIISLDICATLSKIKPEFNAGVSTNISVKTVQCNLQNMDFQNRWPARVHMMNSEHRTMRLDWVAPT